MPNAPGRGRTKLLRNGTLWVSKKKSPDALAIHNLIWVIAEATGLSNLKAREILYAILFTMIKALQKGERVEIDKFGSFSVVERGKKCIHDFKTKEMRWIQPSPRVKFKPASALDYLVNPEKYE